MHGAARTVLSSRVARSLVVSDVGESLTSPRATVLIGEHPAPGWGSVAAGEALTEFLESGTSDTSTLFLISGGASSLCVKPSPPLGLGDLRELWSAALAAGLDITDLNQVRAATSLVGGGALLRWVRSSHSASLIMVDNATSGARWVASALTYDYAPSREVLGELWKSLDASASLRGKLEQAFEFRSALMSKPKETQHRNAVLAEPSMMLDAARAEASARGYRFVDMGARVSGDVGFVARQWGDATRDAGPRSAVIGVGEVTVQVSGNGVGGRCQELAWRMARELEGLSHPWTFLARSSDGRDFVEGVAGAWVNGETTHRIAESGRNWDVVSRTHDTYPALRELGQLIDGGHTGWNLCDIFVALCE
jgi:hydroxypyruvate reductase